MPLTETTTPVAVSVVVVRAVPEPTDEEDEAAVTVIDSEPVVPEEMMTVFVFVTVSVVLAVGEEVSEAGSLKLDVMEERGGTMSLPCGAGAGLARTREAVAARRRVDLILGGCWWYRGWLGVKESTGCW